MGKDTFDELNLPRKFQYHVEDNLNEFGIH